jgi:putative FmdB family regulatory protein
MEEIPMSIYSFVCKACKKKFEVAQSIKEYDPKTVTCPKCNSKKVERIWKAVNVVTSRKS